MKNRPDQSRRRTKAFINVQDLDKLVQERVEEASMPHHYKFRAIAIDASNSPLFQAILEYEFPKKFEILTFDCYSSQNDSVQHHHRYQDKRVIHSRNDFILCQIFLFNLKGVASDWFYFLPQRSIHGFGDLTKLFLA